MIRRSTFAFLLFLLAAPAHAGFDEILTGLETRLGHTMWIPMFGLVRTAVRISHPDGVHDLQLAVFEGKGRLDSEYLDRLMTANAGRGYTPLVRVRSRRDGESTLIYARPIRDLMELLVLTNDGEDTVLVRVVVNPERLGRSVASDPKSVSLIARR
ncbi:MAG TPA: hypothetical protein VF980_08210 [Thermoanaerobaculia bacterium]